MLRAPASTTASLTCTMLGWRILIMMLISRIISSGMPSLEPTVSSCIDLSATIWRAAGQRAQS